ncbi:MAG: hypothetical protein ACRDYC_03315, partial [Acidimicrobiales bacterium]
MIHGLSGGDLLGPAPVGGSLESSAYRLAALAAAQAQELSEAGREDPRGVTGPGLPAPVQMLRRAGLRPGAAVGSGALG